MLHRSFKLSCQAHYLRAFSTAPKSYDVAVIGGGPGGYVAAIKSAQLGLKTVCIESRGKLGGTCLNVGCIPSKALLHGTHLYSHAKHSYSKYGIEISGIEMNFPKLMDSKTKAVSALTSGIEHLFKKNKVDYMKGHGKIINKTQINVTMNDKPSTNEVIHVKNILIATGSIPTPLPGIEVNNVEGKIVDSTGALSLKKVPKHLVVIGGGVIGLELGSVYSRLGSKVTVVEYANRVCPTMDHGLINEFTKILKSQGFEFMFEKKVTSCKTQANGEVELSIESVGKNETMKLTGDCVLVATGRKPFTKNLGLEELGILQDKQGRIEVDDCFRTNIPNIYSIGDCIKGAMLAHKAEEEGVAAIEFIAKQMKPHINYNAIPGVVYTYPEVASVGQTEEELKKSSTPYNVGKFPMMANSRARTIGEDIGFVKVLSCKATDRILGIHIINANAGEMIAEGTLGIEYGASSEDIGRTCHAHPTLSEAFKEACNAAYDKPINF